MAGGGAAYVIAGRHWVEEGFLYSEEEEEDEDEHAEKVAQADADAASMRWKVHGPDEDSLCA